MRVVFPADYMHAEIARLIILYEDLKIEVRGVTKKRNRPLSETTDSTYSQRYFLRRLIATLRECGKCIIHLDSMDDFKIIKREHLSPYTVGKWDAAVTLLSRDPDKGLIETVRNKLGGHVGLTAVKRALETLTTGTIGYIEYVEERRSNKKRRRISCHFVGELTARAFLGDSAKDADAEFRNFTEVSSAAKDVVMEAVPGLVYDYIWPRFGRG